MYIYAFLILCLFIYVHFSRYVSKDGADQKQQSHRNSFVSKGVGVEIQPVPICNLLVKIVRENRFIIIIIIIIIITIIITIIIIIIIIIIHRGSSRLGGGSGNVRLQLSIAKTSSLTPVRTSRGTVRRRVRQC